MESQEKRNFCRAVGARVRNRRETLGITKEQLAEAVGISTQYVSDIEQGKKCMSMAIFAEMGQFLRIGLDELSRGARAGDIRVTRLTERLMELAPVERDMVAELVLQAARLIEDCGRE